ncbi:SemiSWEET family sugar transporter [Chloroflexota bacterium]
MSVPEILGQIAGALVTLSLVPQIIRVLRLKNASQISYIFTGLLLFGVSLWLVYGIMLSLLPVIVWNAVGIFLAGFLLVAKMKYG